VNDRAKELLIRGTLQLGVALGPAEVGRLASFATELKKWNRKMNLTAIHDDEEIVVKHFLDSLTLLKAIGRKGSLLDIGSGAGFPAIPVQIICHDLRVTSVDAVEKKILFQRHAARLLHLGNLTPIHARGEELAGCFAGRFDWVASRAFSDLPTFVRIALPLIGERGQIVAMKGKGGRDEAGAARPSLADMGVEVVDVRDFTLPFSGAGRSLVVMGREKG